MKRLEKISLSGWSKLPVFVSGLIIGAVITLSSNGFSASDDVARRSYTSILYALSGLAVDTEANASKIVGLEGRIEGLEDMLKEITGKKD